MKKTRKKYKIKVDPWTPAETETVEKLKTGETFYDIPIDQFKNLPKTWSEQQLKGYLQGWYCYQKIMIEEHLFINEEEMKQKVAVYTQLTKSL